MASQRTPRGAAITADGAVGDAASGARAAGGARAVPAPLEGIVVADFSRVLSGPWCTMTLGDLGAEIIKIERPGEGDETRGWGPPWAGGESAYFLSTNRSKRSIALDLSRADHRAVAERIVARADVVIENFRPGTMERLGFGRAACARINPRAVYASITGFGSSGPARDRPGYDFIAQGMGGIMSLTGEPGGEPQKVGVAIADITAGLYAAIGILAALRQRDATNTGPAVETSLLGAQVAWLANQAANYLIGGVEPTRMGNAHPNIVPYQVFASSDHPFIVAVANETIWRRLCDALQHADLATDERFATNGARVANREVLCAMLAAQFATRARDEWLALLETAGVPCGPINTIAEVFADEQVRALELAEPVMHPSAGEIRLVRTPLAFDGEPVGARAAPPRLGEHSIEILRELGYSDDEAVALLRDEPRASGSSKGPTG